MELVWKNKISIEVYGVYFVGDPKQMSANPKLIRNKKLSSVDFSMSLISQFTKVISFVGI